VGRRWVAEEGHVHDDESNKDKFGLRQLHLSERNIFLSCFE